MEEDTKHMLKILLAAFFIMAFIPIHEQIHTIICRYYSGTVTEVVYFWNPFTGETPHILCSEIATEQLYASHAFADVFLEMVTLVIDLLVLCYVLYNGAQIVEYKRTQ